MYIKFIITIIYWHEEDIYILLMYSIEFDNDEVTAGDWV